MYQASPLIFATHNQFFATSKQQLPRDRVNAIVSGGNHHLLTRLKAVWLIERFIRQGRRL
ncbi:hypothetical protein D3C84_1121100 [compost metagenome]